jgi:arabinofuranosyltransferase
MIAENHRESRRFVPPLWISKVRALLSPRWLLSGIVVVAILVIVVKNAWVCDDAFITFRTVDNLLNGLGLRWNPDERVQTYTHPLWMLLTTVVVSITDEYYFTVIAVSVCLTLAALFFLFFHGRQERAILGSLAAGLVLLSSQSFIDYSTSGLENSLGHLLISLFLLLHMTAAPKDARRALLLTVIAAIAAVNRLDHLLLYCPIIVYRHLGLTLRKTIRSLGLGLLPLAAWELFSLFYYGFLFPNTAYAKLNTGIEWNLLLEQGVMYFKYSINRDPITPLAIVAGAVIGFLKRDGRSIVVSIGIALYCAYILKIGGDFMSGRFLSLPLFAAVFLIKQGLDIPLITLRRRLLAGGLLAALGIAAALSANHPLLSAASYRNRRLVNGIADERGYYFGASGLVNVMGDVAPFERDPFYRRALEEQARALEKQKHNRKHVVLSPNVGVFGLTAGPLVHIFDSYALVDPLFARLPSYKYPKWRIGHFRRIAPDGYRDTLKKGQNVIKDKNLAAYYDKLSLIIRSDLFSADRLLTILKMNLGMYDHLIDWEHYRNLDVAALKKGRKKKSKKK